jgi:hypothetical protein
MLNSAALFHANIIESFHLSSGFFNGSLVFGGSDDIFQVFQQTVFVFVSGLGLHLSNRLNLTLKNQESLVVKIDAPIAKQSCNCCKVGFFSVDVVFARVVLEGFSGDNKLRIRNDFMATTRLNQLV